MMLWRNVGMALASIRAAKLRAFLTMLGIIIGVSSVVMVLALGEGIKRSVSDEVSSFGANLVQVTPGQAFGESSEGEAQGFNFTAALGASTLTEQDVKIIQNTPNVETVAPFMLLSGVPQAGNNSAPTALIAGTTPELIEVLNRDIAKGTFLSSQNANQNVVVLGHKVATDLFPGQEALGKTLTIRNTEFKIIGLMKAEESEGLSFVVQFENMIYTPLNIAKKLNNGNANIMEIDLLVDSAENVKSTVSELESRLKVAHGGEEDFTVATAEDQLKIFDTILSLMTSFVSAIAGISLLVGGIGVMNIMFVSVTERTKEIGIRKAIGATNRHILTQFLIEAVMVSLIGGLLGVALAIGAGIGIKAGIGLDAVFTAEVFITAIVISTVIGMIFGTAPAVKAARKHPVEALRYE